MLLSTFFLHQFLFLLSDQGQVMVSKKLHRHSDRHLHCSLFCFILSSTRFAFLLISFDVRQICFVRSSTFERKRSISGQSSFLTSCNRLSHDSRSFTKYESCPAHVDQSLLGSTGGSTCFGLHPTIPTALELSCVPI